MTDITIKKLSDAEINKMGIRNWGTWGCEVSTFDWEYDSTEVCYILEGEVTVKTDNGDVDIQPGDYVTFPKGLKCVWDVKKPIRKHYNFTD